MIVSFRPGRSSVSDDRNGIRINERLEPLIEGL